MVFRVLWILYNIGWPKVNTGCDFFGNGLAGYAIMALSRDSAIIAQLTNPLRIEIQGEGSRHFKTMKAGKSFLELQTHSDRPAPS